LFIKEKEMTYIHPATGSRSSIDLAICDPALFLNLSWKVHDDLCGSDHLPVFLTTSRSASLESTQRWNLQKANWGSYKRLCEDRVSYDKIGNSANSIEIFSNTLLGIAKETMQKRQSMRINSLHPGSMIPAEWRWLNEKNLHAFTNNPTNLNLTNLRIFRAKARRTIKQNKTHCWRSYVSKLNSQTPMKKIWHMIRRISGKPTPAATSHLKVNNITIEQPTEIADVIASTIAHNSSSDHYTDSFQRFKSRQEKQHIKFSSANLESYNLPFSMAELSSAIRKAHDSATGPDSIHYQMLKHLPEIALNILLRIFNDSCRMAVAERKNLCMPSQIAPST
jgi:hypothetical protein